MGTCSSKELRYRSRPNYDTRRNGVNLEDYCMTSANYENSLYTERESVYFKKRQDSFDTKREGRDDSLSVITSNHPTKKNRKPRRKSLVYQKRKHKRFREEHSENRNTTKEKRQGKNRSSRQKIKQKTLRNKSPEKNCYKQKKVREDQEDQLGKDRQRLSATKTRLSKEDFPQKEFPVLHSMVSKMEAESKGPKKKITENDINVLKETESQKEVNGEAFRTETADVAQTDSQDSMFGGLAMGAKCDRCLGRV